MLYCKSLNVSIQSFTKDVNKAVKDEDVINKIVNQYSIPTRKGNVFTIDAPGSIDLDDAISVKDNILSIYISHVAIIMDYLKVWDSFTNRISNIYLPDKKRNMLPSSLSELCSLNEGTRKISLVMDINMDTREYTFGICVVKIKHNYTYDTNLDDNEDYQTVKSFFKTKTANDLISKIMILFNTNSAATLKEYKDGIYKNVSHNYDFMKNQSSDYELFCDDVNYLHITSPIRRLVDILNIYQVSKREKLFTFTKSADNFYNKWISQLGYINKCFKSIKKVQNKCKILSIFENEKNKIYKGYVYDKISRTDNKFRYQVHIHELNLIYDLTIMDDLAEHLDYSFKLYVFHDESKLRNKVKLQLIVKYG
jgi:exoribonuclease R